MAPTIIDCQQGTPEWFRYRLGLPTASMFSSILAKGDGKMRRAYLRQLAAEIITGEPIETFKSPAMERGQQMEAEARDLYAFMADVELTRVGFIKNGSKGCSPDALIGNDGLLELKTQRADLLIDTLLKDAFPPEHKAQVQGGLWIAEREWCDLSVFWPRMPRFVKRAYRDEPYIKELAAAVDQFNTELQTLLLALDQKAAAA